MLSPTYSTSVRLKIESLPLTSGQLKQATGTDPILSKVLRFTKNGWPVQISETLKPYWNRCLELSLEGGCVMWGNSDSNQEMAKESIRRTTPSSFWNSSHQSYCQRVCVVA